MTVIQTPQHDDTVERADPPKRGQSSQWLLGVVALLVAAALGFGAGWFAFGDDDGDLNESAVAVPDAVLEVIDEYMVAFETNDLAYLQALVTPSFRRPFYMGDPNGSPWRDVYAIEAYSFMDDPNISDTELDFYDVETVGDRIVRGDGPWYVSEAQNWREAESSVQIEAIQTLVVVEADGEYLVDDAYWTGHSVLVADE